MKSVRSRASKVRRIAPGLVRECCGELGPFDRLKWFTSRDRMAAWGLWLEWRVTRRHGSAVVHSNGARCIGE